MLNKKIRQEHGILEEFHKILNEIAKIEKIQRIIPGRIARKQSGSSTMYFTCSYDISTGWKYKMSKGSTSQELFVVCQEWDKESVKEAIGIIIAEYI
jgi:hypothetical protein